MSRTIKNAKAIQSKSKTHTVKHLSGCAFEVTSGASGSVYHVTLDGNGGGHCTCDWAKYRPASGGFRSGCSHVVAVYAFLAEQEERTVSAWADPQQADRQHRPTLDIGDGVTLTTRKAGV